ncbi:MAG: 1-acyl-sn-glycerol-3-phosphate acyltransferase [Prevotellaceae bacterium]|jgi:1-acyl-sn-glycerol-3-phosphate acyltransferase|nr:1-acyl-sn-glycerol-3-phosphate acyltransferase [Prevotellaceae bacterium]
MPKNKETEIINFVYTHNQLSDKIIFKISFKDTTNTDIDELKAFITLFVDELNDKIADYIKEIIYQFDDDNIIEVQNCIQNNIPYYLTSNDYAKLDTLTTPQNIQQVLENDKQILLMPSAGMMKQSILADPFHLSIPTLQKLQDIGEYQTFRTDDGYFFTADYQNIFLFIVTKNPITETKENAVFVEKLAQSTTLLDSIASNNLKITYFGAIPVSVTNAQQVKADSILSLAIAILLIIIILFLYFRKIAPLLLILLPVFFGTILSFALIVLFKGSLSGIAIGAASAIFGIAVNYSLYFLIHYKEEQSSVKALKNIAFPLTVGSITTVGAFLSLLFVKSDALNDFGLFASLTLFGTLLFVLFCLPMFFRNRKKISPHKESINKETIWEKIAKTKLEKIPFIGLIIVVFTCFFAYFSTSVEFETDFSKLSYMTNEQKRAEAEISAVSRINVPYLYHVSYGITLEEALQVYEKAQPIIDSLNNLGHFHRTQGIGELFPSHKTQMIRAKEWHQFWEKSKEETLVAFENSCHELGLISKSFEKFYQLLNKDFIKESSDLSVVRKLLLNDYLIETPERSAVITLLFPNDVEQIIDSPLAQVEQTIMFNRSMSNKSMITLLYDDFSFVLWFCALLVFGFLMISFGRIELAFITILPMVLGWFWILGIMSLFDIQFNIVNIILATFIFGLGDDYTIFMLEGLIQDYAHKKRLLVWYRVAVILSAAILFIGIGTLIVSKHPAMRSLAQVCMIGMFCVVFMAYTISPVVFKMLTQKNGKPRLQPVTFFNLLKTIYSFSAFVLGCLALNLVLPFFIIPFASVAKRKYWYHCFFSRISLFVSKRIPSVQFSLSGNDSKKFEKPAIIVANHQAHIDLTCIIGLHPKIVVLTNKWVWNTPFYALPMRFADFYPIANDFENNMAKLEKLTQKGYSILIFPEGTRSHDCTIQRFHKGAFYLAEQLKLDILPITIHGLGHILPKKELMVRKGTITIKVGERVTYDEYAKIGTYREVSKWLQKQIVETYYQLAKKIETADYWADKVYHNYVYKGIDVEWNVRKNLRMHKNYKTQIEQLKDAKKIKIINCGYGEFPLLASLVLKHTDIYAYESNEEKFSLAKNCKSIPQNLHYVDNIDTFDVECNYIVDMNKLRTNEKV